MSNNKQITQIEFDTNEIVFHFTDIEGRWQLLERAIQRFNAQYKAEGLEIKIEQDANGNEYIVAPKNVTTIFGGDATDKGDADRRIQRLLINTKNRAIEQDLSEKVILIGGNRDYNQVRYFTELNADKIRALGADSLRPEWVEKGKVKFSDFKPKLTTDLQGDELLEWQYLEWMNDCTMGRVGTIENRRAELLKEAMARGETDVKISDAEVLNSFKDPSLSQQYLELTQMAVKIGNATAGYKLAVHGGLSEEALTLGGVTYTTVESWIEAVNALVQADVKAIYAGEYPAVDGFYSEIERLSLPNGKTGQVGDTRKGGAVSYECWKVKPVTLNNGQVVEQNVPHIDPVILQMFVDSGIYGMLTGHKPTGNSELGNVYVIKLPNQATSILCTPDISFGKDTYNRNVCIALYRWNKDSISSQLITHSNALNEYITANLPVTGKGATLGLEGPYAGGTLYAPDLNKKQEDGTPDPKIFAWQILLCEAGVDSPEGQKMILQRMDGFNAVQMAYDSRLGMQHKENIAILQNFFLQLQPANEVKVETPVIVAEQAVRTPSPITFMADMTNEMNRANNTVAAFDNVEIEEAIPKLESDRDEKKSRSCCFGLCW